jgi:hypothetical protein
MVRVTVDASYWSLHELHRLAHALWDAAGRPAVEGLPSQPPSLAALREGRP